jgi:hypothetical protein
MAAAPMNPGSLSALRAGCRCDSRRNLWGRGVDGSGGLEHQIAPGCPLHPQGWVSENVPRIVRPSPKGGDPATAPTPPLPPPRQWKGGRPPSPRAVCPECGLKGKISPTYGVCIGSCSLRAAKRAKHARKRAGQPDRRFRDRQEVEG